MIEELKALAGSCAGPLALREEGFEVTADIIEMLPAILSALEAVPVMKEALERIDREYESYMNHVDFRVMAKIEASQALAALEGK